MDVFLAFEIEFEIEELESGTHEELQSRIGILLFMRPRATTGGGASSCGCMHGGLEVLTDF